MVPCFDSRPQPQQLLCESQGEKVESRGQGAWLQCRLWNVLKKTDNVEDGTTLLKGCRKSWLGPD